MSFSGKSRRIHYWATAFVALPLLLVLLTGVLLQIKKQWSFVQPPEMRGLGSEPTISFERLLSSLRDHLEQPALAWKDILRIDVRPAKALAKVLLPDQIEAQVDLSSGKVLHVATRRSDLIESLHDGSFFLGDVSKFGIFLPMALTLLLMWVTGVILFVTPIMLSRRRKRSISP